MVGALRYAADCTRPDISFVTSLLARYLQNPSNEHYQTVTQCFGYLKKTKDYWLTLGGTDYKPLINGYSDADGMNQEGYRAISGYVFRLGNSLISWSSKRQTLISLSTYEAELQALITASQEAIWLRHIYSEVLSTSTQDVLPPTVLYCDNKAAISQVNVEEMTFKKLTKHIDRRKEWIRQRVGMKEIKVEYVKSKEQLADMLTKPLSGELIRYYSQLLGLQ